MATAVEHISLIIIRSIRHYCPATIAMGLPDKSIIDFIEAVSFAYLGLLKVERRINVLASVTGASADSSSGLMIGF